MMASGVPVMAPREGGVLSFANDDNAWLADPSGERMAVVHGALQRHGFERPRRIASARRRALELDWEVVCRDLFARHDDWHRRRLSESAKS
jgi:glycosyltransferase involved in cell wall biosynthesis